MSFDLKIKQYQQTPGVYMIRCYENVFKIGCSRDLSVRLSNYPGIYWDLDILNVWPCSHPTLLEQAMHLFLSIECKKIRKGKYELFRYDNEEDLVNIAKLCNEKYESFQQELEVMIESGVVLQTEDLGQLVTEQLDGLDVVQEQTAVSEGGRRQCQWPDCRVQTKNAQGFCHKHNSENRTKNTERTKQHQLQKREQLNEANALIVQSADQIFNDYKQKYLEDQGKSTKTEE